MRAGGLMIYVADSNNTRVLAFRSAAGFPIDKGASFAIGQADTSRYDCRPPDDRSLCAPDAVAVDPAGNLYVADTGNGRVLFFADPGVSGGNGQVASRVFDKPDFNTRGCPQTITRH